MELMLIMKNISNKNYKTNSNTTDLFKEFDDVVEIDNNLLD